MTPDRIASFWETRNPHVQPKPEPTDAPKAKQERERRAGRAALAEQDKALLTKRDRFHGTGGGR